MTQSDLNRAVAAATGETVREIRRRGFSLAVPGDVEFDAEPYISLPQTVDWDQLDAQRFSAVSLISQLNFAGRP